MHKEYFIKVQKIVKKNRLFTNPIFLIFIRKLLNIFCNENQIFNKLYILPEVNLDHCYQLLLILVVFYFYLINLLISLFLILISL